MKRFLIAAVAAASLLSACGGGGNSGETKTTITAVKVVGASLADSGTFGYKFTVQSGSGTAYQVYPERIAATYGVSTLCAAYSYASGTFPANSGCTNYAVAGAKVNNYMSDYSAVVESIPTSAIKQLVDVGNAGFSSGDLLIVGEAAANDAAAVATAYLTSSASFVTLMGTLLDSSVVTANASSQSGLATLGVLYMQALATKLTDAIKANALDKGATRVAVLNTLDVTKTPRFQKALADVSAAYGGGSTGAQAAAGVQALVQNWIQAYNTQLNTNLAQYGSKVAVVDFYTSFNDEMSDPSQYGLSDVTQTVCDQIVNAGGTLAPGETALSDGSTVVACTDTNAATITPTVAADGTTNWWKKYLYADNFHPTPYGHQLLAQLVAKRLTVAGWL